MSRVMRTAFRVAAGTYVVSRAVGSRRLLLSSKPLVVPLLIDAPLTAPSPRREVGLIGLAGGWVGDLLLMQEGRLHQGAAAFAVNQAAYQWLLRRDGARFRIRPLLWHALPVMAAAWYGRRHPVLVATYGGMVTATSILAADTAVRERTAVGGHLFLLSDSLILVRMLLPDRDTPLGRGVDVAVAATYATAQRLLVNGLFRR